VSNQAMMIFLIVIAVTFAITYKMRQNDSIQISYDKIEEQLKEASELSEKIQDKDNGLSVAERALLQQKVNQLLSNVTQQAKDMDRVKANYNRQIDQVNPKRFQVELDSFMQLVLAQWHEHNLTLNLQSKEQLNYIYKQKVPYDAPNPLADDINQAIVKTQPSLKAPDWLLKIDNFFSQEHKNLKYSKLLSNQYHILLSLSLPFVSVEQIVQLKSFDNSILMHNNILPFNVPRDLNESKRLYNVILKLPKKFVVKSLLGTQTSNQAFQAQMLMVMLMQNPTKDEKIYQFLKEITIQAPDYLFDYPKREDAKDFAHSEEPASRMAYENPYSELNEIIYQRSTPVFRKYFDQFKAYKAQQEKYKNIVATTMPKDNRTITQRVESDQMELAKLLEKFDLILKEHNITLSSPLNDEQIDKLQQYLSPYKLLQEYIALYKWHNGMDKRLYMFLPIEEALRDYNLLQDEIEYHKDWWSKNLFPLNSFNGDTYWFVDLNRSNSSTINCIFLENGQLENEYKSIEDMIKVFIQAFEKKIIYYDRLQGDILIKEDEFNKLRKLYLSR